MNLRRTRGVRGIALGAGGAMIVFLLAVPRAQQQQQQQQQQAEPQQQQPQSATPQQGQGGQRGQQGQRGGQPAGEGQRGAAPASNAKPVVPVAANTLIERPDAYVGESVTLTGQVGQPLGGTAFSVQPGKGTKADGKDVLVLAPRLNEPVNPNAYVTAIGPVIKFDPDEVTKHAKDIKVDLPADVVAKYRGQPVILATAVINASGVNLAQRLPPPMSTEEQAFQKVMQQVGPANNALRAAIDKNDANAAKENAAILQQSFVKTEAFWKTRGAPDAIQLAQDAKKEADSVSQALAAGKWDDAKASAGTLAQKCGACHGAHRERFDDGSFRIKTGTN